eukprot:7356375-Karenia_brevis.AAC.1
MHLLRVWGITCGGALLVFEICACKQEDCIAVTLAGALHGHDDYTHDKAAASRGGGLAQELDDMRQVTSN